MNLTNLLSKNKTNIKEQIETLNFLAKNDIALYNQLITNFNLYLDEEINMHIKDSLGRTDLITFDSFEAVFLIADKQVLKDILNKWSLIKPDFENSTKIKLLSYLLDTNHEDIIEVFISKINDFPKEIKNNWLKAIRYNEAYSYTGLMRKAIENSETVNDFESKVDKFDLIINKCFSEKQKNLFHDFSYRFHDFFICKRIDLLEALIDRKIKKNETFSSEAISELVLNFSFDLLKKVIPHSDFGINIKNQPFRYFVENLVSTLCENDFFDQTKTLNITKEQLKILDYLEDLNQSNTLPLFDNKSNLYPFVLLFTKLNQQDKVEYYIDKYLNEVSSSKAKTLALDLFNDFYYYFNVDEMAKLIDSFAKIFHINDNNFKNKFNDLLDQADEYIQGKKELIDFFVALNSMKNIPKNYHIIKNYEKKYFNLEEINYIELQSTLKNESNLRKIKL